MKYYKVKEVSEITGLSTHTLRFYEKEGIIPAVERDDNGIRQYNDENLFWLDIVVCLKETGMKNEKIKEIVKLSTMGDSTIQERKNILELHKLEIQKQIDSLEKSMCKIDKKLAFYNGDSKEC